MSLGFLLLILAAIVLTVSAFWGGTPRVNLFYLGIALLVWSMVFSGFDLAVR